MLFSKGGNYNCINLFCADTGESFQCKRIAVTTASSKVFYGKGEMRVKEEGQSRCTVY